MRTDLEFIRYSVSRECAEKRERYVSLMSKATGERTQRFYAIMAQRKNRGMRRLSQEYEGLPLTPSENESLSVCTVAPDHGLDALASLPDAMLLARKLEFENYCRYLGLARKAGEEAPRRLFLSMVLLFKSDLLLLERLLRRSQAFSVRHV
ncbi:MAG: hypothetical protein JXA71_12515 [Chitinispirillaceae bacterium]|nr:hypothetical protein [Chitinispirillaceae bacterium]